MGRGPSVSRNLSSLLLDEVALPQTDLARNLRDLLDSRLLLEEQIAAVVRRALAQPCVVH